MKIIVFLIAFMCCFKANAQDMGEKQLLKEMLSAVEAQYLEPVKNDEIIITGLTALSELDNDILISKGTDKFYIYYKKKIKKIVPLPKDIRDLDEWIEATGTIISTAEQISEKVALKDFEIPDLMMKKITAKLDKYSHYYSEYDYDEEDEKNAIYTLYSSRKIDDFLYLRVRIFNKQTTLKIKESIENNPNIKGVILDLRGNSGGMLNEALKTADLFTEDEIITYTSGRDGENVHYYTSESGTLYDGPLAVIVDGETASAAEVLAAGLQEQSRAKLVGTKTFGKGTIQNVTQMSNGGKLVLTTEQFFTPSGKVIHGNGVSPDICTTPQDNGECKRENRLREKEDIDTAIKLLKNELF